MKSGFTLIELILVIAIIILIGTMTTPFAGSFLTRASHETTLNSLVGALHRSQSLSLDGRNNSTWGICQTGNFIRVYTGSCLNPTIKEDTTIFSLTTISGLSDTTFSRVNGEPSNTLSITLDSGIINNTVTLNALGIVDTN